MHPESGRSQIHREECADRPAQPSPGLALTDPGTITRSGLADAVRAAHEGMSRQHARRIVDAIIEGLADAICAGGEVRLRGFGRFATRWKAERPGRNPATMQPAIVSARRVVQFNPSGQLADRINRDRRIPAQSGAGPDAGRQ